MPPRLAWFTPLPPVRSGIAAYSAEILPRLGAAYDIEVFVDDPPAGVAESTRASATGADASATGAQGYAVRSAHDFLWRHRRRPFDLIVYQLGNAPCHDYMWPYVVRFPGLVVLHDAQLHHARARALLGRRRRDEYREEFRFNHPEIDPAAAEYVVAGFGGAIPYLWPMRRVVMTAARAVAVHSATLADDLRDEFPDTPVLHVRMGVRDPWEGQDAAALGAARAAAGARVRFATFGLLTPEKRIPQILRALQATIHYAPQVELALVGDTVDHYDVEAEIDALGLAGRARVLGRRPDAEFDREMLSSDVALCLRWPSGGETSAAWLRCLGAGLPTIITDLATTVDVPTLDPRNWTLLDASVRPKRSDPDGAVAVSIDILDEDHSLRLAMRRLAGDAGLRGILAANARDHWAREHTLDAMDRDYRRAIEQATSVPARAPRRDGLPPHLVADGTRVVREVTGRFGVDAPDFFTD